MVAPTWQDVAVVKVEAKPVGIWGVAQEYIPGSRLLRLTVIADDGTGNQVPKSWRPITGKDSGPDGITSTPAKSGLLLNSALYGALIAKLGGSSADVPDSSSALGAYGGKKVFCVGSFCVVSVSNTEAGPLFMTMNDNPDGFDQHNGSLFVKIEEFPL